MNNKMNNILTGGSFPIVKASTKAKVCTEISKPNFMESDKIKTLACKKHIEAHELCIPKDFVEKEMFAEFGRAIYERRNELPITVVSTKNGRNQSMEVRMNFVDDRFAVEGRKTYMDQKRMIERLERELEEKDSIIEEMKEKVSESEFEKGLKEIELFIEMILALDELEEALNEVESFEDVVKRAAEDEETIVKTLFDIMTKAN